MTAVLPSDLLDFADTGDIDELINSMAVSYFDFSVASNYRGTLYGFVPMATKDKLKPFRANACFRHSLTRALISVQTEAENYLGYALSSRYLTMTIPLPLSYRFLTQYPGVDSVEVKRTWHEIGTYPVSFYLLEDIEPINQSGSWVVEVPVSAFNNPNKIFLRNNVDNGTYGVNRSVLNYPNKTVDKSKWRLYIDHKTRIYESGELINVQHVDYVLFKVPKPTGLPEGAHLEVVYPGTHQIIKQALPVVDDGINLTFTLYAWTLAHPDFTNDIIDLMKSEAEFYKLYNELTLAYWVEERTPIEILVNKGTQNVVYKYDPLDESKPYPKVLLVDKEHGVCNIDVGDKLYNKIIKDFPEISGYEPSQINIKLYYKTSPQCLPHKLFTQIPGVKDAIINKVAAEVSSSDCDCEVEYGILSTAKRTYGTAYVDPSSGLEVYNTKYGTAHGSIVYRKFMDSALTYQRPLVVGVRLPYISNVNMTFGNRLSNKKRI